MFYKRERRFMGNRSTAFLPIFTIIFVVSYANAQTGPVSTVGGSGTPGTITTVGGGPIRQDGIPAKYERWPPVPVRIAVDENGVLYFNDIADGDDPNGANARIRKVNPGGRIYTVTRASDVTDLAVNRGY